MNVTTLISCFKVGAQAVTQRADEINKLNVFPVPDGDTGTNMSLTLNTVCEELDRLPRNASAEAFSQAITHGSLMGARGNSGVITSQILRGVAEGLMLAKHDPCTAADLSVALRHARKIAFQAVCKPVEGTILTVVSDISERAEQNARTHMSFDEALKDLVQCAFASVARTPDLLSVLKENGVVDSGAFGFAILVEAFINSYLGEDETIQIETHFAENQAKEDVAGHVHIALNEDWEGSEYRYCTEFLFFAEEANFSAKKTCDYLATQGDCELVVGEMPHFKVHVHTNEPNKVLAYMLKRGQIYEVFIHNMDMEAHDRTASIARDQEESRAKKRKALGFVAVAAGSGEAAILESLGVDVVVQGGQTMNPSTADLLQAIEQVNADSVIVLPNNSNVRMTSDAAATACDSADVAVVPTKTVPQAFAAMIMVSADMPLEDNVAAMIEAAAQVRDGEITHAVRDSSAKDGAKITVGDIIGIEDDEIVEVGSDVDAVCLNLLEKMQTEDEADTLTILAGQDYSDEQFENLCKEIEEKFPDLEIDSHRGEQPLYPIIFSLE